MTKSVRTCLTWMIVGGLLCSLAAVVPAQEDGDIRARPQRLKDYELPGMDKIVNLTSLEAFDVVQLIEFLAHRGGLSNIVIAQGISGLATKLKFEGVTVGDALEVVLSVNKLAYDVNSGIITIMTDEEYRNTHGISFYDKKQVRIVDLKYANPARVAALIGPLKSEAGTVVHDDVTGTLVLIDTPEKIVEMLAVIAKADITTVARVMPTETREFVVQHAEIEDIQTHVSELLTTDVGAMQADGRTRTLIVTDLPHKLEKITSLIDLFDKRPGQVFIEAKILQVELSDDYQLGINWDHLFDGMNPRFQIASAVQGPLLGEDSPGHGSLTYKTILGGGDLAVMIEALKTVGDTKILSNPQVAVLDGDTATIGVIQDTPYAETESEITGTQTNFVGEDIIFLEVGVSLEVTPKISENGLISMDLRPEISSASYDYQAHRLIPSVRRAFAETSVMIKDGETIIIAGMIQNEKRDEEFRVPFFGRIPLVGVLFKSVREQTVSKEMVVFLTPRTISGEEPFLRLKDMKKKPKPLRAVGAIGAKKFKPVR